MVLMTPGACFVSWNWFSLLLHLPPLFSTRHLGSMKWKTLCIVMNEGSFAFSLGRWIQCLLFSRVCHILRCNWPCKPVCVHWYHASLGRQRKHSLSLPLILIVIVSVHVHTLYTWAFKSTTASLCHHYCLLACCQWTFYILFTWSFILFWGEVWTKQNTLYSVYTYMYQFSPTNEF